ncbi:hypothetical protein F0562_018857 [Nyssa sinensis]|uniref:Pectate lyase n=1 Tax=Nyssa sinensis TaxID=561372 RepID=A0A5J4ZCR4_9ASTE|nr:hypothetical protein F0562_018857 [Nyssa sinensis]
MNVIDSCWRTKPNWAANRRALADCAKGFGRDAMGGKYGATYVVTNPSDVPIYHKPGTLRYGVIQTKPLWIIFAKDMVITLKNELIMNSFKTIDGRGVKVEITYGPCITIQGVSHVIIHGISIHDCEPGKAGLARSTPMHVGHRRGSDGDAIDVFASSNVWIDHCFLARCSDGLIDVIHASTSITISNNYFSNHDKVMLFGHNDGNLEDKVKRVTVVFNHFGTGLVQRMPRWVRLGYAHVANNKYDAWQMYAIGGSANPTIFSEGNYFMPPNKPDAKQVTKREVKSGWKDWKRRSSKDKFVNGAYFVQPGWGSCAPLYSPSQSFTVAEGSMVPALTSGAAAAVFLVGQWVQTLAFATNLRVLALLPTLAAVEFVRLKIHTFLIAAVSPGASLDTTYFRVTVACCLCKKAATSSKIRWFLAFWQWNVGSFSSDFFIIIKWLGYAHVANNKYDAWQMYAIGGSANPTIFSEGNYFMAPNKPDAKQVTKREVKSGWKDWKWSSSKDKFVNGAYFVQSGWGSCAPLYSPSQSFTVAEGSMVPALTSDAGPLRCPINKPC